MDFGLALTLQLFSIHSDTFSKDSGCSKTDYMYMLQLRMICTFIFLEKAIVSPDILSCRSLNLSFSNALQDVVLGFIIVACTGMR